jgi:hypothetical protein
VRTVQAKVVEKIKTQNFIFFYFFRFHLRTNNPTSAYALHILNNKHEYGTAAETLQLLKPCHKSTRTNCWETFYMHIFHQHNLLINEQNISDINPLYELADTSRIPLQKTHPTPLYEVTDT